MADKEIFDFQIGSAPALTDYLPVGQDPSGVPVLRKQTLQTIRNLFMGTPTSSGQVPVYNGSTFVPKTPAEQAATMLDDLRTALQLDDFQLSIAGGNLITDAATGYCDSGEMVRTPVNLLMMKVNKFEKGEVGNAEFAFAPSAWDHGTVTVKIKHVDVGGNIIDACDSAWTATQGGNTVCSADSGVKVEGTASAKCAVASGAATGAIQVKTTSIDLRNAKYFSFWIRSSVALNANDISFFINQTGPGYKFYSIPSVSANTWTKIIVSAGDVSAYSLASQIGLSMGVDKGAFDIYIDQVCWQGTVTWMLSAIAVSSGDTLDVAQGAQVEISGDVKFFEDQVLTFPPLTVGGSPAAGDRLVFAITRKNNASDTHGAGKVCFSGADIVMTRG